jgi:hypothetical protein
MKDVLGVFTLTMGALFLVAFFSALKPATVTAALGGMEKRDRCSLTASPTPGCQANGFAALSWSVAARVAAVSNDRLRPSHQRSPWKRFISTSTLSNTYSRGLRTRS